MVKKYRCPCYKEEYTEEEFNNLKENKKCHKYCSVNDCYEYSGDFELFYVKEKEDMIREMFNTASTYGYKITKDKECQI